MFGRNNKLDTGWLSRIGFFEGFSESELAAVSSLGERTEVSAGSEIIDQGRVGDSCYVIVDGTADVYIRGEFVTTVGPGSMVGEMALVGHRPRNATVTAHTEMVLVEFGTDEFRRLLDASPNAKAKVDGLLQARVAANRQRDEE